MTTDNNGPEEGAIGAVEGVKGKAKEVAGAVFGRDDLKQEGEAQQDKADAQKDAAEKEAEAESARARQVLPKSARNPSNSPGMVSASDVGVPTKSVGLINRDE